MYLREIRIENIRCFGEGEQGVHLDLTRPDGSLAGWTVIAGRNGTGKSTLLKAIAMAVAGPAFAQAIQMQEGLAGWVRSGARKGTARILLQPGQKDELGPNGTVMRPLWAGLRLEQEDGGAEPQAREDDDIGLRLGHGPWAVNPQGWMIAGYGPYRRISRRGDHIEPGTAMMAGLRSLFDAETVLNEPLDWLDTVYTKWLGLRRKAEEANERGDQKEAERLEESARRHHFLHQGVLDLLNDGLLPDGAKIRGFDIDGLSVERDGIALPMQSLSDGYRAAIALVLDLVFRIIQRHSRFSISTNMMEDIVTVPDEGVVLIDEIDNHLHITWQKEIGIWLKRHFPNVQFIVTTHSPFICQAADPGGIIRLAAADETPGTMHVSEDVFNTVVNGDVDEAVMTALFR